VRETQAAVHAVGRQLQGLLANVVLGKDKVKMYKG
jgi:hypothetical protein